MKYGSLQLFSETDPAVSWWRERGRESKERGRKVEGRGGGGGGEKCVEVIRLGI